MIHRAKCLNGISYKTINFFSRLIIVLCLTICISSCNREDDDILSPAKFSLDVQKVDFGKVEVLTKAEAKLSITNKGEENLVIQNFSITGSNSSDFEIPEKGTVITIAANKIFQFNTIFEPKEEGERTATLNIESNVGTFEVVLKGTGTPEPEAIVVIEPQNYNFGNLEINSTQTKSFSISNIGNADLSILTINLTGTDASSFGINPVVGTVPAGDSYILDVTFIPKTLGGKSAEIVMSTNVGDHKIVIQGNAITTAPKVEFADAKFKNAILDHGKGITGENISIIDTDRKSVV